MRLGGRNKVGVTYDIPRNIEMKYLFSDSRKMIPVFDECGLTLVRQFPVKL